MIKKTYRRKSIKKRRRTLKKRGGAIENVPVKSILMTDPIFKAIKKLHPEFKPSGFKKEPGEHGFALHKLNQEQNLSLPITVEKYKKIPGYYSIVDGRHRFTKLVARGNNTITVNVKESA